MPLQIRRGSTADRLATTPLVGEIVYDTTTKAVYVGDGTTAGGLPVTAFSIADSRTTTAKMFLGDSLSDNTQHSGITFSLVGNRLNATVQQDLTNYIGLISADQGFKGNLWADDSGVIVNSETHTVYGNFVPQGHIIPDTNIAYDLGSSNYRFKDLYLSGSSIYLGNAVITSTGTAIDFPTGSTIGGQPLGINEGDTYDITISGNVIARDSTLLVDTTNGKFNGDLYGSVFAWDSSILVDARDGVLRGTLIGDVTGTVTGTLIGNADSASVATTVALTATNSPSTGHFITFVDAVTGNENIRTDNGLQYQPSTNTIAASAFIGSVTGDIFTSTIDSSDSSAITVVPSIVFNSDVTAENNLNVVGDIVPTVSEVTNLGTFTKKFNRLYLTEGSNALWIGNAAISGSGSIVDLPAGSTVGGSPITTVAGANATTITVNTSGVNADHFVSFFDAQSGDKLIYTSSNIKYNPGTNVLTVGDAVIGTTTGNLVGNVTGDVLGNVTGNVLGNVTGNVVGNTTGFHTGDVKGSVFGDDSAVLVDSVASIINASAVSGNASGLTGVTSTGPILGLATTASPVMLSLTLNQSIDNSGSVLSVRRSRGTFDSPTTVLTNDIINTFAGIAHDGTSYVGATSIVSRATGTISTGVIPGQLEFNTANSSGTLTTRMSITNAGIVNVFGSLTVNSGVVTSIQGAYGSGIGSSFLQYHNTADSTNFTFTRYRGTTSVPLTVQTGDDIQDIAFVGYDGTSTQTVAGITAAVDGAVATGSIPGKLIFYTATGSGGSNGFGEAMVIDSSRVVDFKSPELVAGAFSGQVDTSAVVTYMKVKINGVELAIPAYAIRP